MPRATPPISRGLLYMLVAALFFSLMSALVKIVGETIPAQEVVFARSFIGLVLSWWMVRAAGLSPWGVNRPLLLLRSLFGFGGLSCFFYAVTTLPLADATVIMYTNPIWTALLASVFLKERLSPLVVAASVASLAGVALVAQPEFLFGSATGLPLMPVAIALAGAISTGAAYVSVRGLRKTDHALVVVLWFPLIATPASVPGMVADAAWPTLGELGLLLAVGAAVQVAQVFMTRGLHLEPAGRATAISYVQVVFAYLWGVLAFDEVPNALAVLGAAVIVVSALGVALRRA